jgi:AcrR family transcriptional regulator
MLPLSNNASVQPEHRLVKGACRELVKDRIRSSDLGAASLRPRDRIVNSACELFQKHGIRAIGVDAIAEAAGTNKMMLYRQFGSKDDLIVACLRKMVSDAEAVWNELEAEHPGDKLAQLRGFVRRAAECVLTDKQSCDMANAAFELAETGHPARRVVEDFKVSYRNHLARLCGEAGIVQGELLADTLCLLVEGARVSRQSVGAEGPSARFVRLADVVIDSFARRPLGDELAAEGALAVADEAVRSRA